MLKVSILKNQLGSGGGLEKYTRLLTEAFLSRGCELTLVGSGDFSLTFKKSLNVVKFPKKKLSKAYHLYALDQSTQNWLAHHPQDRVVGMERCSKCTHYRAGNGVHRSFLEQRSLTDSAFSRWAFRFSPHHQMVLSLEKKLFESPDLHTLFVNSEMVKNEILSYYTINPEKLVVIHNGVDWDECEGSFNDSINQQPHTFRFLFIGHGYKRKGLSFLLDGLALLKNFPFELTVVGKDKQLSSFHTKAAKLQIEDKVHFVGPQDSTIPFYQNADALVIPSIYDPFANVTLEALAMGVSVVTSKFNGGAEVVNSSNGVIIEELTSPESVAEALKEMMKFPKTAERAVNVRQSISQLSTKNQVGKMVDMILKDERHA